jgi:hypothetical protein
MNIFRVKPAVFLFLLSSFLFSCGELDVVLPSAGTYQVDALVNETSLNECSLINKDDRIYPYFGGSVANDPDVTGLLVFLQDFSGQTIGQKIHYTVEREAAETGPSTGSSGEDSAETGEASGPEAVKASESITIIEPVKIDEPVTLIPVNRLDKNLPFFTLPDSLEVGHYIMTFQVLGKKEILYREEKAVYFLEDAEFSLGDIQKYLPDVAAESHLIPPGLAIMLEAQVLADERLDPYIVWYSGRKRLSEGRFADGAGLMLWKAPEQTGFHTIRAEVFPVQPVLELAGKSREITLPISSKAKNAGYFSPDSENIVYWYQFQGNLQDSKTPVSTERALIPRGEKNSRWLPEDNIYGLAAGPKASYFLPLFSLAPAEESHNSGRFMLRFKPVSAGTVLSALFKAASPADQICLNLSVAEETLNLDLIGRETSASISLRYIPEEGQGFITLFVDFSILDGRFDARLSREDDADLPAEPVSLSLASPLSGEGSFQLGDSLLKTEEKENGNGQEAGSIFPEEQTAVPVTALFDEFALSRLNDPVVPLPEEPDEPELEAAAFPGEEEALSSEENVLPETSAPKPAAPAAAVKETAPLPEEENPETPARKPAAVKETVSLPEEETPSAEPSAPEEALLSPEEETPPEVFSGEEAGSSISGEDVLSEPQDVS